MPLRAPLGYGLVLVLIVSSMFLAAAVGPGLPTRLAAVATRGGTLLVVLAVVRARRGTLLAVASLVVAAFLVTALAPATADTTAATWLGPVTGALLVAATPVLIMREIATRPLVDAQTLLGTVCVYLLIGLFFASVYGVLASVTDQVFASGPGTRAEHLYFSLVTLTTVGFGDLVPGTDLARITAALEALIGQLYLVTIVAVVVSRLGRERTRTRYRGS